MNEKPHIIIFNVDQWRGDVLGHVGNTAAKTPNLDKIVEEDGVSFSNAFCQNPVCTPSRCSFMTGWYPHVRGHRTMYHMLHLERGEPNLLRILKDNGYFVWWGGRNDLIPGQQNAKEVCDIRFWPKNEDLKRWGHKWKKICMCGQNGEENKIAITITAFLQENSTVEEMTSILILIGL